MITWRERVAELEAEGLPEGLAHTRADIEADNGLVACDYCAEARPLEIIADSYGLYAYCPDCAAKIRAQATKCVENAMRNGYFID